MLTYTLVFPAGGRSKKTKQTNESAVVVDTDDLGDDEQGPPSPDPNKTPKVKKVKTPKTVKPNKTGSTPKVDAPVDQGTAQVTLPDWFGAALAGALTKYEESKAQKRKAERDDREAERKRQKAEAEADAAEAAQLELFHNILW